MPFFLSRRSRVQISKLAPTHTWLNHYLSQLFSARTWSKRFQVGRSSLVMLICTVCTTSLYGNEGEAASRSLRLVVVHAIARGCLGRCNSPFRRHYAMSEAGRVASGEFRAQQYEMSRVIDPH